MLQLCNSVHKRRHKPQPWQKQFFGYRVLYLDNHISGGLFTVFDCAGVRPVEVLSVDGRRAAHATRHSVWVSLSQCEPVHITGQYFTFGRLTCFHCQTRLFTIFTSYENIVIFTKIQTVLRAV